jgi:hypothetical protein
MINEIVCTACGHAGSSKTITKGHLALEIMLWLFFLLPGMIYSVWRHASRYEACPICGNANLLPISAPMAQKFLKENFPEKLFTNKEVTRPPSKAAHSAGRALGRFVGKFFK